MFATLADAVGDATILTARPTEETDNRKPAAMKRKRRVVYWNDIRDLAQQKWLAAGSPSGDCVRFWLEAEQELQGNGKPS